jgi:hypothetical protein
MKTEELSEFLESIGGLENGYYSDRPKITNAYFFNCDSGWNIIIKNLIEDLIELGWDKKIVQVKEKFGGLRFYVVNGSDEIYDRISTAEKESYKTCEKCGEKGELRNDIGWYLTLCENHYNEKKESYGKRNTNV